MPFKQPMLARPLKAGFVLEPESYAVEEKFDGHRITCEITSGATNLFTNKQITAWSRYGNQRVLPTHILEALCKMPDGHYDGELLVPGKRSYGVTELVNSPDLTYFIFDILEFGNGDLTPLDYDERRSLLTKIIPSGQSPIQLAASTLVNTWDEIYALRDMIWARDGEGLILKRRAAPYQIGKRSKDFIKIKALRSAVLTVTGFIPGKGLINDRGPFATIILHDDDGNATAVKTRNDAECRKLEAEAKASTGVHPAIGRKLAIEYQERTPDGNYRHPRFDHWI